MRTLGRIVRYLLIVAFIALLAGIVMVGWRFFQTRLESVSVVTPEQGASVDKAGEVTEPAEEEGVPEVQEPDEAAMETPLGATVLFGEDGPIGHVFFPNKSNAPTIDIAIDEGGFTIVALGQGSMDSYQLLPVENDIGHVVLIKGQTPDGDTPSDLNGSVQMSGYVPGHVGVTQIYESSSPEAPEMEAELAALNMYDAPNCGAEGCNKVYLWLLTADGLELIQEFVK